MLLLLILAILAGFAFHKYGPAKYRHIPHLIAWTMWFDRPARYATGLFLVAMLSKLIFGAPDVLHAPGSAQVIAAGVQPGADQLDPPDPAKVDKCARPSWFADNKAGKVYCPPSETPPAVSGVTTFSHSFHADPPAPAPESPADVSSPNSN